MNDGQRLLSEDLNAHAALEHYRSCVVVVVVVLAAREHTNTAAIGYWIWGELWRHITRSLKGSCKGRLGESSLTARIVSAHKVRQGPPRGEFPLGV